MTTTYALAGTGAPLFAVFTQSGDPHPRTSDDLYLMPCPCVVLKTDGEGGYELEPKIVAEFGLTDPHSANFLGFADSLQQALECFAPRPHA